MRAGEDSPNGTAALPQRADGESREATVPPSSDDVRSEAKRLADLRPAADESVLRVQVRGLQVVLRDLLSLHDGTVATHQALVDALKAYGKHTPTCDSQTFCAVCRNRHRGSRMQAGGHGFHDFVARPCSCGLLAALALAEGREK